MRRIASKGWWRRWVIGAGGFTGSVILEAVEDADLALTPRCALLTELYVHPLRRGQGWAATLMQTAFKYADSNGLDLVTYASPFGVRGMSKKKLQEFYLRMGFQFANGGETMVRYAKARN
jgi:GNAT superfamily N-acetyltransferase